MGAMGNQAFVMAAIAALAVTACSGDASFNVTTTGGVAMQVEFDRRQSGLLQRGLRAADVPTIVDRLEFAALDVDGSTLATTNLYANPGPDQLQLTFAGGSFRIDGVPLGANRTVIGKGYLSGARVAYAGRVDGIDVRAGRIADIGVLLLRGVGPRIAELDEVAPKAPLGVQVESVAEGGALTVSFSPPNDDDLAGYVVAVGTSSAVGAAPVIERGRALEIGTEIAAGIRVRARGDLNAPTTVRLDGLRNAVTYTIVLYAHDADESGAPLNYSPASGAFGIPADTKPPNAVESLTVTASASEAVITFVAPMDPSIVGYEVRVTDRTDDLDEAGFNLLPYVEPPAAGRTVVAFARSFEALGFSRTTPFFIGVRTVDDAGNASAIAIARYAGNEAFEPSIDSLVPAVALAQREVTIRGIAFGDAMGSVRLTTTGTSAETFLLRALRWTDDEIVVRIPFQARSGNLFVMPADGRDPAQHYLPVVVRANVPVIRRCATYVCSFNDDAPYPFAMAGGGAADGSTSGALYRECCMNGFIGGVERIFGLANENVEYPGAQTALQRSNTIAATYSAEYDRFLFVASNQNNSMSSAMVSIDPLAPNSSRQTIGVVAGNADRVAAVFLDGGSADAPPAMIAFSRNGVIRTATVANAATQPFNAFFAISDVEQRFDRVTIGNKADATILMAYRSIDPMGDGGWLTLRENRSGADPTLFAPVNVATRPRVGPNFEVLAVPAMPGDTTEWFALAFESIETGGRRDVRLMRRDDYGRTAGYAPFAPSTADRRLADAGLVMREGRAWIAILVYETRPNDNVELRYTEVPQDALQIPFGVRGAWPGVELDIADETSVAQLGCKPLPQNTCPIAWLGESTNVLFVRR